MVRWYISMAEHMPANGETRKSWIPTRVRQYSTLWTACLRKPISSSGCARSGTEKKKSYPRIESHQNGREHGASKHRDHVLYLHRDELLGPASRSFPKRARRRFCDIHPR